MTVVVLERIPTPPYSASGSVRTAQEAYQIVVRRNNSLIYSLAVPQTLPSQQAASDPGQQAPALV
jgi:hypothetical protein